MTAAATTPDQRLPPTKSEPSSADTKVPPQTPENVVAPDGSDPTQLAAAPNDSFDGSSTTTTTTTTTMTTTTTNTVTTGAVSSGSTISTLSTTSLVPAPAGGESIYRTIMNRLTALEANHTLYARYVEEHTSAVQKMLRRVGEDLGRTEGVVSPPASCLALLERWR
jgi:hypothetical protein